MSNNLLDDGVMRNWKFGMPSPVEVQSMYPNMIKFDDEKVEPVKPEPEEWVWVEGYKGTDKDMCCNRYQYHLGCTHSMDEKEVRTCYSGFHLCPKLSDVFGYYKIENNNRFFKVTALVRKSEAIDAGLINGETERSRLNRYFSSNKLAAKVIIFTKEMTIDEIFEAAGKEGYNDDEKKLIMEIGIREFENRKRVQTLIDLGYSELFSKYLVSEGKFYAAEAVGSQPGLSMEMKCLAIFTGDDD